MTKGRTDTTVVCYLVTYNRDNKITVVNPFISQVQGNFASTCQLNRSNPSTICKL